MVSTMLGYFVADVRVHLVTRMNITCLFAVFSSFVVVIRNPSVGEDIFTVHQQPVCVAHLTHTAQSVPASSLRSLHL